MGNLIDTIGLREALRKTKSWCENKFAKASDFNEVSAQVTDNKSLLTEIKGTFTALQSGNSDVTKAQVATNTGRITQAESDLNDLSLQVSGVSGRVEGLEDSLSYAVTYGIEYDVTISSPTCTRIGNMSLHKTLPIQSKMRRCLLSDDGVVNYYLSATDSTKKADGTDAVLDGTDGQVMVEMPEYWVRFETDGNKRRVLMSLVALDGYTKVGKMYISAYEASLQRSTNKLSSVVNLTEDYRGGNGSTAYDSSDYTLLGRPISGKSLTNFRTYARNRKSGSYAWNCYTYDAHKSLTWLFVVEYATLNSQATFNASLDSNGYHQGGLGDGVTDLVLSNVNNTSGGNPIIPCGHTNSLGNATGVVGYTMPSGYEETKTTYVPSYRGVENIFGHLWKWSDGLLVNKHKLMICNDASKYASSVTNDFLERGTTASSSGFIKEIMFGVHGDILPIEVGAGSTTYFCDLYYQDNGLVGVLFGGAVSHGSNAGVACVFNRIKPESAYNDFGSRLCYIPQN